MKISRRTFSAFSASWLAASWMGRGEQAFGQEGLGPFMPHEGGILTTAWANAYGPDAESWIKFANVTPETFDINYSSSRGMEASRRIRVIDRQNARTLILGYNSKMPQIIENTTTLGTSTAVLEELRSSGSASMGLISDTSLKAMEGQLRMVEQIKMNIMVDGQPFPVPVVHATGQFSGGRKQAQGDLYFLDNRNNPLLLQYSISFKGEKTPRSEQVVLVTAGAGERSAMEQALSTVREYVTRGIHFDFDKATIGSTSKRLLDEIATTLKNNTLWTLEITGHTDAIGDPGYNQKLSQKRADSVKAALGKRGIEGDRLSTAGAGSSDPVASNKTLEGRAQNRRVVLKRTDR